MTNKVLFRLNLLQPNNNKRRILRSQIKHALGVDTRRSLIDIPAHNVEGCLGVAAELALAFFELAFEVLLVLALVDVVA